MKTSRSPRYLRTPIKPTADQEYLGMGGYGSVRGLSSQSIRKHISENRGILRQHLTIKKTFKRLDDYKNAIVLDHLVNSLDPSRQYLKSPIVQGGDPPVLWMRNQGQNIVNYAPRVRTIFEHTHQLLLAIYILLRTRAIHYDIKKENIVMDDRSPIDGVCRLGLIDYDLLIDVDKDGASGDITSIYYAWPMEKHISYDDGHSSVFCPTPASSQVALLKCTIKMIKMWEMQCKTLQYLIPDLTERQKLVNIGKVAIVHRNYPDARAIEESWDEILSRCAPEDCASHLLKKDIMLNLKHHGDVISTARDKRVYTKDPIVSEYIRFFFDTQPLPLDWTKIDPFGMGLVLIEVLLKDPSFLDGRKDVEEALRACLFRAVHPDPAKRHDARTFLQEWLRVLSMYGNNPVLREALREARFVVSMLAKNPRATRRGVSLDLSGYATTASMTTPTVAPGTTIITGHKRKRLTRSVKD